MSLYLRQLLAVNAETEGVRRRLDELALSLGLDRHAVTLDPPSPRGSEALRYAADELCFRVLGRACPSHVYSPDTLAAAEAYLVALGEAAGALATLGRALELLRRERIKSTVINCGGEL